MIENENIIKESNILWKIGAVENTSLISDQWSLRYPCSL